MTPNEINEAIARSLGVKTEKCSCGDFLRDTHTKQHIKNYYSSLDACAEFEATIQGTEAYLKTLAGIVEDDEYGYKLFTATAPQRCEAYLKMKGLHKE